MIHDSINNDLTAYYSIEIINQAGKEIIALHITSAPNKPYYLTDKGLKPSGVYIRFGSTSINATDEIIRKMIVDTHNVSYETEISSNQKLTFKYIASIFQEKNIDFNNKKYKSLKLISGEKYNNLALLLSDQNPFTIKCAVFEGKTKTTFKDRKEFTGSIIKQVNDAFDYLNLINRIQSKFDGLVRIDKKDYPDYSLREALLNSVIHRSYYFNGSILLSVFDDRIEMNSIGGLIGTLTLNDIYNGVSESRNPNLAELFHRLNYVENYGTGIGRIMREYLGSEKKPSIELSENVFKITLPNKNYVEQKESMHSKITAEEIIINYLKQNMKINREKVEEILQMSKSGTRKVINKLIENDLIMKEGSGRSTYYILK